MNGGVRYLKEPIKKHKSEALTARRFERFSQVILLKNLYRAAFGHSLVASISIDCFSEPAVHYIAEFIFIELRRKSCSLR